MGMLPALQKKIDEFLEENSNLDQNTWEYDKVAKKWLRENSELIVKAWKVAVKDEPSGRDILKLFDIKHLGEYKSRTEFDRIYGFYDVKNRVIMTRKRQFQSITHTRVIFCAPSFFKVSDDDLEEFLTGDFWRFIPNIRDLQPFGRFRDLMEKSNVSNKVPFLKDKYYGSTDYSQNLIESTLRRNSRFVRIHGLNMAASRAAAGAMRVAIKKELDWANPSDFFTDIL